MKIASQVEYNFKDDRRVRQSARDFICQYLDSTHVDLILKIAYEMDLTTEDATAYAMAFFNGLQDLFYFHHNLELGEISVTTVRDNGEVTNITDKKKVFSFREALKEPYFGNRKKNIERVISYLKRQSNNKKRFVEGIQINNPEVYFRKKERASKKAKKAYYEKVMKPKLKRIRKRKNRNKAFFFDP